MNTDTRDVILGLYWEQKMSVRQIAKELDIPKSTLHQQIVSFGIRTRNKKKAGLNYYKKNKLGRYKKK